MTLVLARNWWAVGIRGAVAVFFGLAALILPGLTLAVLVYLFGAYALVDGIFALVSAVRAAEAHRRWWPFVWEGVVGIIAGVLTYAWPGMTALFLLYLIAFWAIFTGALKFVATIRLRKGIEREWALGLNALAAIAFGVLLIIFPGAGAVTVAWLIGLFALFFGVLLLMLAFRLRRHLVQSPAA